MEKDRWINKRSVHYHSRTTKNMYTKFKKKKRKMENETNNRVQSKYKEREKNK